MNAHPPRALDRWLHRAYSLGTGMSFFITRRVRPAGLGICTVGVVSLFMALGQERDSIYLLFSFSTGLGMIALLWAFLRRAKLAAKRELPPFATVGEEIRYTVRVHQIGGKKRALPRVWLSETPPDPRPRRTEFLQLREPEEQTRNAFDRRFAYYRWQWLLLKNRLFEGGTTAQPLDLPASGVVRVSLPLRPLRRGIIRLDDLRVLLPDPFGFFQRCRKIAAPPATLTVLPRRYALPPLEMPGMPAYKIGGDGNSNTMGNSGEFLGLRDYRPGDPLRQIHWKSWARTGRPIVKELEETHYARYGLIVDTHSATGADDAFEEVISVAASFSASMDTGEALLDLMFVKDQAHLVTVGRGLARAEKLLEVLAAVTPETVDHFEALASLVLRHRDDLTSCLVILNGWDENRSAFLQRLRQRGITCVPIIIGHGSRLSAAPGYWLETGYIARDLQRLPNRLAAGS